MRLIGHAQRPIAASPARVWERLADVGGWKAWMPGVRWAVLERGLGAGGYVTIRPLRGRQTAYHVLVADAPRTLALGLTFGPVAGVCCTWTLVPDGFDTLVTETACSPKPPPSSTPSPPPSSRTRKVAPLLSSRAEARSAVVEGPRGSSISSATCAPRQAA
jgi:hypothetical protein